MDSEGSAVAVGIDAAVVANHRVLVLPSDERRRSLGIHLVKLRYVTHAAAGVLTGLAGALLGLAIVGTFSQNIVNGRGFIALACVILGAWRPRGIVLAALIFGAADAYSFQANVGAFRDLSRCFPTSSSSSPWPPSGVAAEAPLSWPAGSPRKGRDMVADERAAEEGRVPNHTSIAITKGGRR